MPLLQLLLIGRDVLGFIGGELFLDELGGQSQKAFWLNSAQGLKLRVQVLLEIKEKKDGGGEEDGRRMQMREGKAERRLSHLQNLHIFCLQEKAFYWEPVMLPFIQIQCLFPSFFSVQHFC